MPEKLGFPRLVEDRPRVKRITRVMSLYQFVLAMVPVLYVGFCHLNHFAVSGAGDDAARVRLLGADSDVTGAGASA